MTNKSLIPVEGCWVQRLRGEDKLLGQVLDDRQFHSRIEIKVCWNSTSTSWVQLTDLQSGFQPGWLVQDVPVSTTRRPLGSARVVGRRKIGGREQLLVQLDEDGRSVWLPYENIRRIKDVRLRYWRAETGVNDHAGRFRLKLLAHALENWNNLTGSLDRLDVDPLPHQIQLVHHILSSGNYNWLIADDVGLGKTIEVGLLLAALSRRGQARRVLIVSPAGLTRQWQDELQFKFGRQYQIYGTDFTINRLEHWKLYNYVIVSIDRAKHLNHFSKFEHAEGWDVVVFDEGHKLTRYASGERAQRYSFAEMLRHKSDAFLLLSGTPHQGYSDRFAALLELVRPDLTHRIQRLTDTPEVISEIILRNRKTEVTDADGNFIFKGHQVRRVPIKPSAATIRFQELLKDYLIRGYKAGEASDKRAIGFVMTTYRKLASSSIAAIETALKKRRDKLTGGSQQTVSSELQTELTSEDLIYGGDEQDGLAEAVETISKVFFAYEETLIDELIERAVDVYAADEKLRMFLDKVVKPLISENKKLLIFTEYRATQQYLKNALETHFQKADDVLLINGSMKLDDKLAAIEGFNNKSNYFLISTEAGGEGLNLHYSCHILVNYDLPWNPARLLQRIGRLYRYGQQQPVLVVNLHARDSFDNAAIDIMMTRVGQMVEDMAPVGSEFNNRLHADILGDVLDNLDFSAVLRSVTTMEIQRTREEIDKAIARARKSARLQNEILTHAVGYSPNALQGTLGFTMQHVESFVRGMLSRIEVETESEHYRVPRKSLVFISPIKVDGYFGQCFSKTQEELS